MQGGVDEAEQACQLAPPEAELRAWLQLLETPRLGRQAARRLLAAFGSPQRVLAAGPEACGGLVEQGVAHSLVHPTASLQPLTERTLNWLAQSTRHHVLVLGDEQYPTTLLESPDPPLLLYACGRLDLLQHPNLAMVGSRHPTGQGRDTAREFARELAAAGVTVTSGLALGIDAAAHEGALEGSRTAGSASTIAVVGTGLDQIYPRSHRELGTRLAAEGLLLSEFSLGAPPLAQNFPQRNRIIAGLSLGTLVVEAALQSGSLITARLATEAGREVFAVPGSIHAPQSRGCHALIKQGAKLVECIDDILGELRLGRTAAVASFGTTARGRRSRPAAAAHDQQLRLIDDKAAPAGAAAAATVQRSPSVEDDDAVLQALGWSAATLDVLLLRTGWSVTDLSVRLLTLELDGHVERLPGELFQRVARA
jgi:DNA processing protein